jgi:hypothetical protein
MVHCHIISTAQKVWWKASSLSEWSSADFPTCLWKANTVLIITECNHDILIYTTKFIQCSQMTQTVPEEMLKQTFPSAQSAESKNARSWSCDQLKQYTSAYISVKCSIHQSSPIGCHDMQIYICYHVLSYSGPKSTEGWFTSIICATKKQLKRLVMSEIS